MPNRNSKAGHIPQRTCVVCRAKAPLSAMLAFVLVQNAVVLDIENRLQSRRFHLCRETKCFDGLMKWKQRHLRKRGAKQTPGGKS